LVLQLNAANDLTVSAGGNATFAASLSSGATYTVTVKTQPSNPTQICVLANATGSVGSANVTNLTVTCTTSTFTVGGTVSGLTGAGLVLQNNAGNDLTVTTNGTLTFTTAVASGSAYAVTVKTQPTAPSQTCALTNATGTVGAANISNVTIACTTNTYTVGGTVSGLVGTGLVLQNNAANDLTITANGVFTFSTPVASGAAYAVTIKTQPGTPAQTCAVAAGSGTATSANISAITVTCVIAAGRFAYVANAGSNTVSAYTIAANGSLAPIAGSPFAAGQYPYQLAVSPSGKFLAVGNVNGNSVSMYNINATSGALSPVAGSPFTATAPQSLTFDATGAFLYYVASQNSNNVLAFSVNATSGALVAIAGAALPAGSHDNIVLDPSGKFVLVVNVPTNITAFGTVSVFAINQSTGALTAVAGSPFNAGQVPYGLAFGAGGKFVYVSNTGLSGTGNVSAYNFNSTSGVLSALAGSPFSLSLDWLTSDRAGSFMYSPLYNASFVSLGAAGYSINATTGALSAIAGSPFSAGSFPSSVAIDPSTKFLYVCNDGDGTITGYTVNAVTGALTAVPGSPFAAGQFPDFMAIL
jgi:6-phosphogluconolactonase (cycloisomerase 2 family)